MLVVTPASSTNTSRRGSMRRRRSMNAARSARISSRSCSVARRVFFSRQAEALQGPAQGRGAERAPGARRVCLRLLRERGIAARGHELTQRPLRTRDSRPAPARGRLGVAPALMVRLTQPAVDGALADAVAPRGLGAPQARLTAREHPLAQVRRIRPGHGHLSPSPRYQPQVGPADQIATRSRLPRSREGLPREARGCVVPLSRTRLVTGYGTRARPNQRWSVRRSHPTSPSRSQP
jgi:hypothetical protein